MRVAIVGATGSFGKALARRLVEAGVDVIVGSRDEARARETAAEVGAVEGMTNDAAVRAADFAVLAVNADAALDTARDLTEALGETPLLSVAAELSFGKDGVRPASDARSLAERVQDVVRAPVVVHRPCGYGGYSQVTRKAAGESDGDGFTR